MAVVFLQQQAPRATLAPPAPRALLGTFLLAALLFLFVDARIAPIALPDESRIAGNALEMYLRGFSLVTTWDFRPELWNTKPPLLIWLSALSMHIFGPTEWAFRLPSAFAAIGTLALTLWFVRKVSGSLALALGSGSLLLLSPGFFGEHGARTGEYDATLLFFVTGGLMLLMLALSRARPSAGLLVASGAMIALGALTKTIAAFIPVVGAVLYILMTRRTGRVLAGWKGYVLAGTIALVPLLIFYAAREAAAPGYLHAVLHNDIAGRYGQTIDTDPHGPLFYVDNLLRGWFFAGPLLLALPLAARALRGRLAMLGAFAGCIVVAGLLVYSSAGTRAMQYALPLFPWLAILAALTIRHLLLRFIVEPWRARERAAPIVMAILLLGVFGILTERALWWRYEGFPARQFYPQSSYGNLFSSLSARGVDRLVIIDPGVRHPDYDGYTPLLHWHRQIWSRRGLATSHFHQDRRFPHPVASCEPGIYQRWSGPSIERIGQCAVRWPNGREGTTHL